MVAARPCILVIVGHAQNSWDSSGLKGRPQSDARRDTLRVEEITASWCSHLGRNSR